MNQKLNFFSTAFIAQIMNAHQPNQNIMVTKVVQLDIDNSASILAVLASANSQNLIGHFGLQVDFTKNGLAERKKMVMKIKPHGNEIVNMLGSLAIACGQELATVYAKYQSETGFQFTHLREQEIYKNLKPSFTPKIYGLYTDVKANSYIILMEYLEDVELLNSVMEPEKWTHKHIKTALKQMAGWHAKMLKSDQTLGKSEIWESDLPNLDYMINMMPLWRALLKNASEKFPQLYTPERVEKIQKVITQIPIWGAKLNALPKTLIHNDLNPRNTCLKLINGNLKFCAYDWELATFQIPHYDVAELLCFVLDQDKYDLREAYLEYYRNEINQLTGLYDDEIAFKEAFIWASFNFGIHRLGMYMMAHTVNPYPFLPRVVNNFFDSINQHPIVK